MNNDKLKPCPFCGKLTPLECVDENEAEYLSSDDSGYSENPYFAVVCAVNSEGTEGAGCGASGGYLPTKKEAIERWNKRAEVHDEG